VSRASKKEESSLYLAKQNLEKIFDNLPDPIFVTDRHGNILLSNSTTALTLDMSLEQLLRSNVRELVRKGYYNKSYALEAVEKKQVVSGILITKLNIKQISTSTPVLDESGNVVLVVTSGKAFKNVFGKYTCAEERAFINQQKREVEYLRSYVLETDTIVAESKAMRQILLQAHNVAQTDSTVLLYGETGTGKEVLAKYLHRHSKRSDKAFIAVNCANLPEQLVESELFGYDRGAFTGANSEGKMGLFEAAHNGTLFLDEIAELPLSLQSKLLRVLETYEVRRLGSHVDRKMDFRLIVATHKDLKKMTEEGLFRRDLYYRLEVIPILIPPLRERPEDIIALSLKFVEFFNKKYGAEVEFDVNMLESFKSYNWVGNVRELRNAVERKVINSLQDNFTESQAHDINTFGSLSHYDCFNLLGLDGTLKEVMKKIEEQYINKVLAGCEGRIGETADKLGIYRTVLYRKLKGFKEEKTLCGKD